MTGVQDQDMVQTFFPDCLDPAFSICVCISRLEWSMDDMNTYGLENSIESLAEFAFNVVNQET